MKEQSKNKARESLKICNNKLRTLLNITLAINSNLPTKKLLAKFRKILIKELNIPKFILFWYYKKEWRVLLKSHVNKEDYESINIESLLAFDDIEITLSHKNLNLNFDFIIPIKKGNEKVAYMLISDIGEGIGISPSLMHLQFVQTLTNIIIVAIQNKILHSIEQKQKQLESEMRTAAEIQKMLIPKKQELPFNKNIKVSAFYMPHFEVGGDYFDIIKTGKNEYYFCIGDVTGKGVSAALIMANFQANLRSLLHNNPTIKLEDLILRLNKIINETTKGTSFITLFLAKYNTYKRRLIYVNAGHPYPLLYNEKINKVIELKQGCPGIGMIEEIKNIKIGNIKLKGNSKLLCFTDGFFEPILDKNKNKKFVYNILQSDITIDRLIESLVHNLQINKDNKDLFDDVTLLGMEFPPGRFNF